MATGPAPKLASQRRRYNQPARGEWVDLELPDEDIKGLGLSEKELKMAEELVNALEGKFDPKEFRDEYRERLAEFLEAKAKGKHPKLPQIKEPEAAGSLDQQLAKSLAAMKRTPRGKEKRVA